MYLINKNDLVERPVIKNITGTQNITRDLIISSNIPLFLRINLIASPTSDLIIALLLKLNFFTPLFLPNKAQRIR